MTQHSQQAQQAQDAQQPQQSQQAQQAQQTQDARPTATIATETTTIRNLLLQGNPYVGVPFGVSMWPMLRNRQDIIAVMPKTSRLGKNDVGAFVRNGKTVLHRVIEVRPDGYVFQGDNCVRPDGFVPEDAVIGRLDSFTRNGKTISCTDPRYRAYAALMDASRPARTAPRLALAHVKRKVAAVTAAPAAPAGTAAPASTPAGTAAPNAGNAAPASAPANDAALHLQPAQRYAIKLLAAANGNGADNSTGADFANANAKTAAKTEAAFQISPDLWPAVQKELSTQSVLAAPMDLMGSLGLTQQQINDYIMQVMPQIFHWNNYMAKADQVNQTLRQAGVNFVVLKGAAAAASYPHPDRRAMGDIDLLAPPDQFQSALEALQSAGWTPAHDTPKYARHVGLDKEGFPTVELHRHFSSSGNKQQDSWLDAYVFAGIDFAQETNVNGHPVPMLPPLANGLVLLAHINQHLGTGLGFRQIIDWQMFVAAHLDDHLWYGGFQQAAREIGMEKLAVTATAMCVAHLGLRTPATWYGKADPQLADELLAYVSGKGNMGRKVNRGASSTRNTLRQFRNPVSALRYLYAGGRSYWKPAQKHAWLAPAACVYQVGHLARKGFARGASAKKLSEDAIAARQETDFLKRLGVTII